jgi:RND family efflux transporter MFP subunit
MDADKKTFRIFASIFLLLQVGIIALLVFFAVSGKKKEAVAEESRKISVEVYTVHPKKVSDIIEIPARIEAWNSVDLSSEVEGQIVFIGAEKGAKVVKGALILKIDESIYAAKKLKAEAELLKAKADFTRCQKLFESNSIAEKDLDTAKNLKALAESELVIAKTALDKCEIRSPIAGYLDQLPVDLGEYLMAGKLVAVIEEVDKVKLVVGVPENSVRSIKVGMTVDFIVDSDREYKGKIIFLATAADNNSLSFKAEIEVDNSDLYFRPGMIVKVKVVRRVIEDAIVVPLTAVIPKYGAYFVYLADPSDTAVLREIKVGFVSGREAVVFGGLKPGDRVVVEGVHLIRENESLRIMNVPDGAGAAK